MLRLIQYLWSLLFRMLRFAVIGRQMVPVRGREFTDSRGMVWNIWLTVGTVSYVRQQTGVLLTGMFADEMKLIMELSTDFEKLVNVLWAACREQADASGITAEEFAQRLGGDALGEAGEALVRATADFFTSPEQRQAIHALLDKLSETATEMAKEATATIQKTESRQMAKSCLGSVMKAQESPASLRTGGRLAS